MQLSKKLMNDLIEKFNLKTNADWLNVTTTQIHNTIGKLRYFFHIYVDLKVFK